MLIFGMSLGYLYLMTVVGSFCLFMSSFSFMKNTKEISENIVILPISIIFSIIPILNFIFSILFLILSLKFYYDPKYREELLRFKEETHKQIREDKINEEE